MDYEGLEVAEKPQKPLKVQKAHKRFSDAPEVVQEEKQFVLRSKDHDGLFYDDGLEPTSKFLHHRICGTRRVMIWMIVLLLVVVGAVTIGVGVSQSKKR